MERYLQNLLSDQSENDALEEIVKMLDEEKLKKPSERDYDKIEELARAYSELANEETFISVATERGLKKLIEQDVKRSRHYTMRRFRTWFVVAVAVALIAVANTITVRATNQDIVSFIINYAQNGFSVTPIEDESVIELPTTPDDPYGIKGECARYGLEVEAPTYLPEGFYLWDVEKYKNSTTIKKIVFRFRRGKAHLQFSYTYLYDENAKSSIPCDHFNLKEVEMNEKSAITSKEDGQYNLICYDGNLEYLIFSDNLNYDECDKVTQSIQ